MIKTVILATVGVLLAGCSTRLEGWEHTLATKTCEPNAGVDYVVARDSPNFSYVVCNNGKLFYLKIE